MNQCVVHRCLLVLCFITNVSVNNDVAAFWVNVKLWEKGVFWPMTIKTPLFLALNVELKVMPIHLAISNWDFAAGKWVSWRMQMSDLNDCKWFSTFVFFFWRTDSSYVLWCYCNSQNYTVLLDIPGNEVVISLHQTEISMRVCFIFT